MDIKQLETEILSLPPEARADLAHKLLISLEDTTESEFDALWGAESVRRLAAYEAGETLTASAQDVAEKARALLR